MNLTLFNTIESNIITENKSSKKKTRSRAAKFFLDLPQQLPDPKLFLILSTNVLF